MKTIEVLAPAGSFESMKAAVNAGADAVYIGGARFGARAYADNLDQERMLEAIDYAHLHGVSLYMTVNTLLKEAELDGLYRYLLPYYEQGLDAVIVQDFGVLSAVRRWFPDMHVHASTQMTVTGAEGAALLKKMGVTLVVKARELSLRELAEIHEQVDIEIESFVHGALCYCYSGQCLLSSLIGGRSGNRGRCAQPCRLPYEVWAEGRKQNPGNRQYVMSMKDLCTLDILPDILESGVYSLKIEGRMKSPRYTAGVTAVYRKYADRFLRYGRKGYHVDPEDRAALLNLFDRGGQTEGYYRRHNGRDMVVMKEKPPFRPTDGELFDRIDRTYVETERKEKIDVKLTAAEEGPLTLSLRTSEDGPYVPPAFVTVTGPVPQKAKNQPMTATHLERQIRRTGDTPFVIDRLTADVPEDIFVPVQALNELRREGIRQLEDAILKPFRRKAGTAAGMSEPAARPAFSKEKPGIRLHVLVSGRPQFLQALKETDVSEIQVEADGFLPAEWGKLTEECRGAGKACVLALPAIFRAEARTFFRRYGRQLEEAGFDGLLARTLEELGFFREFCCRKEVSLYSDYSLYCFNHMAAEFLTERGAERVTFPLELNERELRRLAPGIQAATELTAYGFFPVMVTAQCVRETVDGCVRRKKNAGIPSQAVLTLKDRTGKTLPVRNHCAFCYNTIYNPEPLSLLGLEAAVEGIGPSALRLQFLNETPEEMSAVIRAYGDTWLRGRKAAAPAGRFTRGHMKRGVE